MDVSAAYEELLAGVQPPARLRRAVLDCVGERRGRRGAPDMVAVAQPSRDGRLYTRRGFMVVGACAVVGACGLGVRAALRRDPAVPTTPVGLPTAFSVDEAEAPPSLQISEPARATLAVIGDGPGPHVLPPTDEGAVWVDSPAASGSVVVRLNLVVHGEGISAVHYSLEDDNGAPAGKSLAVLEEGHILTGGPNGDTSRRYYGGKGLGESLEATVAEDGSIALPPGDVALLWVMLPKQMIREVDPLLDLYLDWRTLYQTSVPRPDATDEERDQANLRAQEAWVLSEQLDAQLTELYEDLPAFYAWMRACHGGLLELLAQVLVTVTLVVEVDFQDGTQEAHRYRLGVVDDFAEVCGERFDALMDSSPYNMADSHWVYSMYEGRPSWTLDGLPTWFFVDGEPYADAVAADERLARPLFTIAELPPA